MDVLICSQCGSNELQDMGSYYLCPYCETHFPKKKSKAETNIDLSDDVSRLLAKCKQDPRRASRYASLILDIDPTNQEALKYL